MISEITSTIPDELFKSVIEGDSVAPCFTELEELSEIDNIDRRVIVVRDEANIKACAVCNIEQRRHHGLHLNVYSLFGYLVHDYCRIFCKSAAAMECLKTAAINDARKNGCDIIVWENIPAELVPDGSLPIQSNVKLFTVGQDQGWERFYKSKHVKYLLNKVKKLDGEYHVSIIDGYVPDDLMAQFADFHIKRWRFAGSGSPFTTNKRRISEYRCHPSNKHYLRILSGDELIACHYGMKYGDTLLFHTPIINPKYLNLSPMKLILAETAKYCEEHGLRSIDFGHGDEAYKDGYCTLPRYTCNYERAISIKGLVAKSIGKLPKDHVVLIHQIRKLFSKHSNRIVSKCIKINFKSHDKVAPIMIDNWVDFCDFSNEYNRQLYKEDFDRFRLNKSAAFIGLIENNKCVASAWLSRGGDEVTEFKIRHIVSDLYFETDESLLHLILNIPVSAENNIVEIHAHQAIFDVIEKGGHNNLQVC